MPIKFRNFLHNNIVFILIIILAALIRFWHITYSPPSLNWDEVSHGYNAYSILKNGRDEWGVFFPIIFRAYGDYKLPIYIYLTVISELLFGLTPFAVRFFSVIAGVGTVVLTYLLCLEIFHGYKTSNGPFSKNIFLACLSSLLVAVEPWSFFVSRGAFEANLALFFFLAGMYFFFKFMQSNSSHLLLLFSSLFLGLTVWTYNSYRIFTPLIIIASGFVYFTQIRPSIKLGNKLVFLSLLVLALSIVPMFYQLFTSVGHARYSWVQILDQGTIAKIEEARNYGGNKLVHNRITYFFYNFVINYFSHFSPKFLFFQGGDNYQFSVPKTGILYPVNLAFFYLGLAMFLRDIIKHKHEDSPGRRKFLIIVVWTLLAPIPSSLTREAPHVLRAVTFIPIPMIMSAFGLYSFAQLLKNNKKLLYSFFVSYLVLLASMVGVYLKNYFIDYRLKFSQSWQYGYRNAATYIKMNYSNYDKIIFTKKYGEPHEFLLFYLKWDPQGYFSDPKLNRYYQSNWYWVDGFDKFYFVNDWEISENSEFNLARSENDKNVFKLESGKLISCHGTDAKCLLITTPGNYPEGWNKLENIDFLDDTTAFEVYEN